MEKLTFSRVGILMVSLGEPSGPSSVLPFLLELFADRDLIKMPFQSRFGPLMARVRCDGLQAQYEQGNAYGALTRWTAIQAAKLAEKLNSGYLAQSTFCVFTAMRYGEPGIPTALQKMKEEGVERGVLLSMYPHYSTTTTGSNIKRFYHFVRVESRWLNSMECDRTLATGAWFYYGYG